MEYPIKLPPLAEIKAKALAALEAGELQCQREDFFSEACLYDGPCAIGVALPETVRKTLDEIGDNSSIFGLVRSKRVERIPSDDLEQLTQIQRAHDDGDIARLRALLTS